MDISGYKYTNAEAQQTNAYLWPPTFRILEATVKNLQIRKVFDLGCGSGAFANQRAARGYAVSGVDPSFSGIEQAKKAYPHLQLEVGSTDEDLVARFGTFQAVTSFEVIEHVFAPRPYAKCIFNMLAPEGVAIISTPYNGYLKNLAVALLGKYDKHYTALWDNGHIKFWSINTLGRLLAETGFDNIKFLRVGRIPVLAKSMIAIARKPK